MKRKYQYNIIDENNFNVYRYSPPAYADINIRFCSRFDWKPFITIAG